MKVVKSIAMDYAPEGSARGYQFGAPNGDFSSTELTTIWENAFPKGRNWSSYVQSRSVKTFPLGQFVAISNTTVTEQMDSHGRGGIRRVHVDVITAKSYDKWLQKQWQELPQDVTDKVNQKVQSLKFDLEYFFRTYSASKHASKQIAFVHPFVSPEQWQLVEALVFKVSQATSGFGGFLNRRTAPTFFTTLALQPQQESRHVAIPSQCLKELAGKKSSPLKKFSYWHLSEY